MSKERIDEMKKFIQLAEGTWSLPQSENQYRKLAEILFGSGPKMNAAQMKDALYNIYGDDHLFDMLDELETTDIRSDARPYVVDFLKKNDPLTYKNLYSLGKAQTFEAIHKGRKGGKHSIDLSGPEGNAFVLLGYARDLGRQLGWDSERVQQVQSEMQSGDYENLLTVFDREFGDYVDLYRGQDDELEEGLGDKIAGWFFKKGTEPLIAEIEKFGPMSVASMIMQKPEKTQRALVQGAKHYLENVKDHAGLRKFVEIMGARENIEESDEDETEMFYVIIIDGENRCVARLEKMGGYWHEECVFGNAPDNFTSKRYMSYLSPEDIISWLNRDYSTVAGPFADEYEAEIEMDRMAEEEDDESWMYENVNLTKIVGAVLHEASNLDFDFDDWEASEDPATNLCPACKGEGCEECDSVGEVFEATDLIEKFEDAAEIASEMAEENPETPTDRVFKVAAKKAGIKQSEMKQFWEWLDEQGIWIHPDLLETEKDPEDEDLTPGWGDSVENNPYNMPNSFDDDGDNELEKGLRFD